LNLNPKPTITGMHEGGGLVRKGRHDEAAAATAEATASECGGDGGSGGGNESGVHGSTVDGAPRQPEAA